MKIGVVIPCYNEENRLNISEFINFIIQNEDFIFCFVNDGSTDKTCDVLSQIENHDPLKVRIINNLQNQGKSEAVRSGLIMLAYENLAEYIGYMDADLATPLQELYNLKKIIIEKKRGVIFGSRIIHLGGKVQRHFFRFLLGRIFATIVSRWILYIPIYDTQCGFKFFKRDIILLVIQEKFKSKWFFDIEIFQRIIKYFGNTYLATNGLEYFLETWEDKSGSKLKINDFLKTPFEILKLKFLIS